MLYNLYRPSRFGEVLGQEAILAILKNQTRTGNFHHAYLFYGPSGTGKTSTARVLAMAVNCPSKNGTGEPCLECAACKSVLRGGAWDVIEIDCSDVQIAQAREIKSRAYLSPFGSSHKVYIFDECQLLSEQVFNSFLKLLEEPPPHLVLILTTTNPDRIPLTVKSRCQLYHFRPLIPEVIKGKLTRIAQDLDLEIDQKALDFMAETAAGNMRSAENVLEQVMSLKQVKA